jgi:hypothetical protein
MDTENFNFLPKILVYLLFDSCYFKILYFNLKFYFFTFRPLDVDI